MIGLTLRRWADLKKFFFSSGSDKHDDIDSDINLDDDSVFVFSNVSSDSCSKNVGCEEIK